MTKFIEQRVDELENQVAKLELIVHELRGKKSIEPSTTTTVEDIIEFEGVKYRKVERKARESDVVIFTKIPREDRTTKDVQDNKPYKVRLDLNGRTVIEDDGDSMLYVYGGGVLEGTPETVDVYELIKSKPLTPNQQRAAIIEKAKQFVEEQKQEFYGSKMYQVGGLMCDADFQINQGKRAITCLIKHKYNGLVSKGIAKCNPTDVFNEWIGKAIAIGRALGLDVSEFEQAVQPTKPEYGMIVLPLNPKDGLREVSQYYVPSQTCHLGSDTAKYGKILNDTNAIYGGVE